MYIHIGDKKIVSDKQIIGIFNTETIKKSDLNIWLKSIIDDNYKVIAIGIANEITGSNVSPFTIINRNVINNDDLIWSSKNVKRI